MRKLFLIAMILLALVIAIPAQTSEAVSGPPGIGVALESNAVISGALSPVVIALQELRGTISGLIVIAALIALSLISIAAYFYLPVRSFPVPINVGLIECPQQKQPKPGDAPAVRKKPAAAAGGADKVGKKDRPKNSKPAAARPVI